MEIHPGLIASEFLITKEDEEDHAFQIWLWDERKAMLEWAERHSDPSYYSENTQAMFSDVEAMAHKPCQFLGHLHFVKDDWDLNAVAHELMHAFFRYAIVCFEDFTRALFLEWRDDKEQLCYEYAEWVDWTYRWLWKKNPNPKWVKEKRGI